MSPGSRMGSCLLSIAVVKVLICRADRATFLWLRGQWAV